MGFQVKYDGEGRVKCFKGRLVAQGYSQQHGIDYYEIFAPVVRLSSIHILFAFAIENKMEIHQMNVVGAFLNGELKEEIFMQQPPGYVQSGKEELVCKLQNSCVASLDLMLGHTSFYNTPCLTISIV